MKRKQKEECHLFYFKLCFIFNLSLVAHLTLEGSTVKNLSGPSTSRVTIWPRELTATPLCFASKEKKKTKL